MFQVEGLVEKPGEENTPSQIASVGGYLLTPDILPILQEETVSERGEIELSEAINTLSRQTAVYCQKIEGVYHDTGDKLKYLMALVDTGLEHPDIAPKFRQYLEKRLIK